MFLSAGEARRKRARRRRLQVVNEHPVPVFTPHNRAQVYFVLNLGAGAFDELEACICLADGGVRAVRESIKQGFSDFPAHFCGVNTDRRQGRVSKFSVNDVAESEDSDIVWNAQALAGSFSKNAVG